MENIQKIKQMISDIQVKADNCAAAAESCKGTTGESIYRHTEYEFLHIIDCLQEIVNEHNRTRHIFDALTAREN